MMIGISAIDLNRRADAATYTIVNTGGVGVRQRMNPAVGSTYSGVAPEGAAISVECQTWSEPVGTYGNRLWLKVRRSGVDFPWFIADTYTNSPRKAPDPALPGIPMCATDPAPTPAPAPTTPAGPPKFRLPFKCGETAGATTYDTGQSLIGSRVDRSWPHANYIDLAGGAAGKPVLAAAAGLARLTNKEQGQVTVDHGNGWSTVYQHMTGITVSNSGRNVAQGEQLGVIGSGRVGTSSGPHLHFAQLFNGVAVAPSFTTGSFSWSAGKTVVSGSYRFLNDRVATNTLKSDNGCPTSTQPGLSQYASTIVKVQGDPATSWYVTSDLKRLWIPDGGTFNELKARGASGPIVLPKTTIDRLPDMHNFWAASGSTWTGNRTMRRGMSVWSADNRYRFTLQLDGNLVLYGPSGRVIWATSMRTGSWRAQEYIVFQPDGNLVTYGGGRPIWWTGTGGRGGTKFVVQSDGNLVIYAGSKVLWSSGTGGRV